MDPVCSPPCFRQFSVNPFDARRIFDLNELKNGVFKFDEPRVKDYFEN
jgi:hypothetical protein